MQALVTYPYRDRETGEVRYAGDAVELTAERFRELALGGYVDEMPGEAPAQAVSTPAAEKDEPKAEPAPVEMTAAELRSAIEAKGGYAPKKATKAQLAEILGSL